MDRQTRCFVQLGQMLLGGVVGWRDFKSDGELGSLLKKSESGSIFGEYDLFSWDYQMPKTCA